VDGSVEVPLWVAALSGALLLWAALDRLLVPSVRWFIRRRTERLLEEMNQRLPIKVQPFQRTKRQVLIDRLLYDPKVMEAAEHFADRETLPREVVMRRVHRYAKEIVPAFNAYLYFRVGYALARRVARALYRVRLGYSDEEGIRGIPSGATVVFVMNHRSNMDYILVGYMAARRTALSYAVGEWAKVWPLRALVRSLGGYFVRRNSRDDLYRRVLERYVAMATAGGVTQALYPEGGLSRDGLLREPKLGLLEYMLRGFDPKGERDLVFVPVGLNYDRTLEDRTLLLGLEPGARRRSLAYALAVVLGFASKALRLRLTGRWYRFGYACVTFGRPLSVRRYLSGKGLDLRALGREAHFEAVKALGAELMAAVGEAVPVTPVSVVATVLIEEPGRPRSELGIKARAHELFSRLREAGAHVYIPRRDADYAVGVGLRMLVLRNLVVQEEGLYRAVPEELPLLRYYANSIAHLVRKADGREALAKAVAANDS
jgi:glycerol-3-phosphate O-acyltransferase